MSWLKLLFPVVFYLFAAAALSEAETIAAEELAPLKQIEAKFAAADAFIDLGHYAEAYRLLHQAVAIAEVHDNAKILSQAWGALGNLHEKAKRYAEAMRLTDQAIFFAQAAIAPEWLFRWSYQKGRLLKAQGKTEQAVKHYEQAIGMLGDSPLLDTGEVYCASGQTSFYESFAPLFLDLADLYLQRANAVQDKRLLFRAREVIEALKRYELREYFRDACVDKYREQAGTFEDALDEKSAIIYPILLQDRMELLVQTRRDIQSFSVNIQREAIEKKIHVFRGQLQDYPHEEYLETARQLYEWLITPFRPFLPEAIQTLVFVPEGPLRTIPMAALYDGKEGRYLIQQYALAITPGLKLTFPGRRKLTPGSVRVLLGATNKTLGFAMDEIAEILALYSDTKTLLINDNALVNIDKAGTPSLDFFFRDGLIQSVKNEYSLIHIASHAEFMENPQHSYIETHDSSLRFDELEKLLKNKNFYKEPVELLSLSACETAGGDNETNEKAALGLSGITVKAGVRSALGTLWETKDEAAYFLVKTFYTHLTSGSKARALQAAQNKLLKTPVTSYGHPYDWAPFVLVGNWL
ncbi:MAG: CHAT domain-containing protein [Gammaproteobacteria bacterium]|nr:CHAT domain-containing protein [Gammaproteobacteria bacterium]